jgi:hypothetical protein
MGFGRVLRTGLSSLRDRAATRLAGSRFNPIAQGRVALAWTLYWSGDMVSRWNDHDWRFTTAGFRLYQWLMASSDRVQGDGSGPWHDVPPEDA